MLRQSAQCQALIKTHSAALVPARPAWQRTPSSVARHVACSAKKRGDDDMEADKGVNAAANMVSSAVDSLSEFVPETVPRPVAKGGVAVVGGLLLFGLLQKVLSGLFTLALLGAAGYWWLTRNSGGDDDDIPPPKQQGSKRDNDDMGDPLSEARRIMDKYK